MLLFGFDILTMRQCGIIYSYIFLKISIMRTYLKLTTQSLFVIYQAFYKNNEEHKFC
jgi:hypothetical protein